tara:strand:+ start:449 stop:988 length:540 start_codon:yes stop_codon:yes gene_type:complete
MRFLIVFIAPLIQSLLPIKTEKNISLPAYIGEWHQVATSRSTALLGTGIHYSNVTANYNITNTSDISVVNHGFNGKGKETSISGYSYANYKTPTKRKVHFDGVPTDGNYWITKLGPIKNNQYQYAIVCGPISRFFGTRFSLYVLARNKQQYMQLYENTVKEWCKKNFFIFYWNEYVATI